MNDHQKSVFFSMGAGFLATSLLWLSRTEDPGRFGIGEILILTCAFAISVFFLYLYVVKNKAKIDREFVEGLSKHDTRVLGVVTAAATIFWYFWPPG